MRLGLWREVIVTDLIKSTAAFFAPTVPVQVDGARARTPTPTPAKQSAIASGSH